jgi:regulatory protein
VTQTDPRKPRPPYDGEALVRLALHYAGRYATTRAKLKAYLGRKVRERGWAEEGEPPIEALAERVAALGYVDDPAFAAAKARSMLRKGLGERRLGMALDAAGIAPADAEEARALAREQALEAGFRFAARKRIGPFAAAESDRAAREKAYAAMLRAGHPSEVVRAVLNASPADIPDLDAF